MFTPQEGIDTLTPLISQLRASLMNQQATGTFEGQVFFQLSEDSCTWDPPIALDGVTYLVGNGSSTTAWYSATSNYKRYIRFGVTAAATGGTIIAMANCSLIIDILLK